MSEAFSSPESVPFSETPDAGSAANALRAAASGEIPAPRSTEEKTQALKEAASQRAAQIRDFAGEKAQSLKAAAGDRIGALREGAGETANNLADAASEQWQETRVKAKELHGSLETYVRENPTKAVLSAVGAGFVLGLLIRR